MSGEATTKIKPYGFLFEHIHIVSYTFEAHLQMAI